MGVWTWLERWDGRPDDAGARLVEEAHVGRLWHALHVGLTGEEEGGEPPGCYVVWTTPGAMVSFTDAGFTTEQQGALPPAPPGPAARPPLTERRSLGERSRVRRSAPRRPRPAAPSMLAIPR